MGWILEATSSGSQHILNLSAQICSETLRRRDRGAECMIGASLTAGMVKSEVPRKDLEPTAPGEGKSGSAPSYCRHVPPRS